MTAPAPPLRAARRAVSVAFAVQGVCFASLVTRIPTIKDRFGLTDASLAGLLVLVPVLAGVGSVAAGALAQRWGSRQTLRWAGPVVPVSLVLVGFAPSLPALVASLVLVGLGLGSVDATMNMQGLDVQSGYGRPVISSFYAVFSLATICGAAVAAGMAATALSLGVYFTAIAVVAVPCQLAAGRWLLTTGVGERVSPETGSRATASRVPWRPIVLVGLGLMCVYVLDSGASNWSAVYLTDALGSSESVAALAYACYSLTLLLGRTGVDRVVLTTGAVRLVRIGGAVATLAVVGVVLAQSPVAGLAAFAVLGLGVAPVIPLAFTAAASHDPGSSGVAVARVNVFNYAGFVLGAPLVGLVAESSSLRWGFAVLIPVSLAVVLLAPWFRERERSPVTVD